MRDGAVDQSGPNDDEDDEFGRAFFEDGGSAEETSARILLARRSKVKTRTVVGSTYVNMANIAW
jgi:hypothetical protein